MPLGNSDRTEQRDPLLGAKLGDYTITRRLGEGAMGVVYAGVQPVIGKPVAIKVLQRGASQEEDERLLAEARALSAINHRGIVDIFSFGRLPDGRSYLVMEQLEGDPLDRVIAESAPVPAEQALALLEDIVDALSAAHAAGLVHRDLKPSNVFVVTPPGGNPYVKLLDFGLAKRLTAPSGSPDANVSTVVGTPSYISPEQALGQRVGPQSDLYALGCTAFELLTGRVPFYAATSQEVVAARLKGTTPRISAVLPDVLPELDDLVFQLMQRDPADRPPSAEHVRQSLRAIARQASIRGVGPNTGEQALDELRQRGGRLPTEQEQPAATAGKPGPPVATEEESATTQLRSPNLFVQPRRTESDQIPLPEDAPTIQKDLPTDQRDFLMAILEGQAQARGESAPVDPTSERMPTILNLPTVPAASASATGVAQAPDRAPTPLQPLAVRPPSEPRGPASEAELAHQLMLQFHAPTLRAEPPQDPASLAQPAASLTAPTRRDTEPIAPFQKTAGPSDDPAAFAATVLKIPVVNARSDAPKAGRHDTEPVPRSKRTSAPLVPLPEQAPFPEPTVCVEPALVPGLAPRGRGASGSNRTAPSPSETMLVPPPAGVREASAPSPKPEPPQAPWDAIAAPLPTNVPRRISGASRPAPQAGRTSSPRQPAPGPQEMAAVKPSSGGRRLVDLAAPSPVPVSDRLLVAAVILALAVAALAAVLWWKRLYAPRLIEGGSVIELVSPRRA